jgi:hypothetical protein
VSIENGKQTDSLLNKKQAAHYLGISSGTLERLMRSGLPYIKLNCSAAGAVRFSIADLADFVAMRRLRVGDPS